MKKNINLEKVRKAALLLSRSSEKERNRFLTVLGAEIVKAEKKILAANAEDVRRARAAGMDRAFLERLVIDHKGVQLLSRKLASVVRLKSGLGETIEKRKDKRGLVLTKVRVPLGVLAVIYEARPEVTIDVAALCVKSGNAAILKGGSEALKTNTVLYAAVRSALKKTGLPQDAVQFVATGDRQATYELLKRHDAIDLVIARGSYGMVKSVLEKTSIPVLAHAAGGARIYVDKSADLTMAEKILVNAKTTKPAACNSLDTVLVDRAIAKKLVPRITKAMRENGVSVQTNMDWDTETLGLTVGIKVVSGVDEAITFVNAHSKKHSEGIVAKNKSVISQFMKSIDAAAVFVNASTRLHDGYEFGLGSEMGISTSKLHARGPVGLQELTTYTWHIYGKGNIR
ncbi:glutamate-5-semialdehyde dehydrogenase [Patescibacteria group bacterium]|nr:glutamate-5-semialdehyde dehydrogenase [Patescibacteria group bacterium]